MDVAQRVRYRFGLSGTVNPWRWMLRVSMRPLKLPLCWLRRHRHWERETMLIALGSGRSKRCRTCNRLVLKPEFR
jgi:hypothetical protein